jgi:pimeloyl-ACP methyl ester carboxylesterase
LLRTAHWLSNVEHDARSPVWTHWIEELSRDHTYIRYDQRGCGLSDRSPSSTSFEAWLQDLEAVVEAQSLKKFPLFGMSQGGAIAIAYAARHPDKVSHLILFGAYARGALRRNITEQQREEAETLIKLIRLGWGRDNPAFRQVFTSQFIPDGTLEQHQWFNDLERISASPENAVAIVETLYQLDVSAEAASLPVCQPSSKGTRGLTASEQAVLTLVAQGLDNAAIAAPLTKSEKTVRNQVSSIFAKLGVSTRSRAIVLAREAGIGGAS